MHLGFRTIILLICVFLTIGARQVSAAERLALIIGNSAYANAAILKNSVNDAKDIAGELQSLGFHVELGLDLDYQRFSNLVSDFRNKVKSAQATEVVFYYAGHGFQLHGLNHVVPIDAKLRVADFLPYETLQLNQIIKSIRTSENQTLVVLLDACRNNPLPENIRGSSSGDGLAQLQDVDGAYVVFATQPGNVSQDGIGRNGPFAAALLKYTGVAALSISELMIEVRRDVRETTKGGQIPWDLSTLSANFYFNPAMYGVANESVISTGEPSAPTLPDEAGVAQRIAPALDDVSPSVQSVPNAQSNQQKSAVVAEPSPSPELEPVTEAETAKAELSPVTEGQAVETTARATEAGDNSGNDPGAKDRKNEGARDAAENDQGKASQPQKQAKPEQQGSKAKRKASPPVAKPSVKKAAPAKPSVKKAAPVKSSVKKTAPVKPVPKEPVVIHIRRPRICAFGVVCL